MNNPETVFLNRTDSTNRVAFAMAKDGAVHGTAVIAEEQDCGRGRLGKQWSSPAGKGLYCSIIVRPRIEPVDFPLITMTAGLSVALSLDELSGVVFGLKWPNDIYRNGKKCGGILVESSSLLNPSDDHFAVVGIGINVDQRTDEFGADIVTTATSLYLECDRVIDKKRLFSTVRSGLLNKMLSLQVKGFAPILKEWKQKDILFGRKLSWVNVKGKVVSGVSLGPDDNGRLHIREESGLVHEVISGDISLAGIESEQE